MDRNDIQQRIIKLIAKTIRKDVSEISADSSFKNDLQVDSLDQVEVIMAIESEFECNINDLDADKISTVNDAVEYILSLDKSKNSLDTTSVN